MQAFMQQSKLIILLKCLSTWELKTFEKMVHSPFYNVNENVGELYSILKKFAPGYTDEKVNLENISKLLFKSKKANLPKLRYAVTDLTRLLEKYMVLLSLEKNMVSEKKLLLQFLNERNADKFFSIHLKETKTAHKQKQLTSIRTHEHNFMFDEINYEFFSSRKNRSADSSLQNLSNNLDLYYLTLKLKYACEMVNRENILNVKYDNPLLKPLLANLNQQYLQEPLVLIYHSILLTLTEPANQKHFQKLKLLLQKHTVQIEQKENRDIYAFAQNYCIRKVNAGETVFLKELFELYKTVIQQGIILDNNQISHADFKNICTIALRCNELRWTEAFIGDYQLKLPKDLRDNAIVYNTARLQFTRKDYKQALKLLTQIDFTDVYYHLDSKSLLLKVYYETGQLESLYSLIITFKTYLKRSKLISEYQRSTYNNLIKYVRILARYTDGKKVDLKKTGTAMHTEKNIADIGWLKEKLNELQ